MEYNILLTPYGSLRKDGKNNAKNYPYFAEVIDIVKKSIPNVNFIQPITGQGIIKGATPAIMDLKEVENFLLEKAHTWLSVDTFTQHMVNSLPFIKPGVVVFGPSDPELFGYRYNVNLLKSRNCLIPNQYQTWNEIDYNKDVFIDPEKVAIALMETLMKPKLSVIIPTVNNIDGLKRCVDHINRYSNPWNIDTIVVANGTSDENLQIISEMENITLINHGKMVGYTQAVTDAYKYCKADYVMALNDDVYFYPLSGIKDSWIYMITTPFYKDPLIKVVGPYIIHDFDFDFKLPFVLGAALAISKEDAMNNQGYNNLFNPGYGEDLEICWRHLTNGSKIFGYMAHELVYERPMPPVYVNNIIIDRPNTPLTGDEKVSQYLNFFHDGSVTCRSKSIISMADMFVNFIIPRNKLILDELDRTI